jgi:YfiH family protein
MDFSIQHAANRVWYGTFAHFSKIGIKHGVATRIGGISEAPYHSLNLGMQSGDDIQKVAMNRKRLYEAIGIDPVTVVNGKQIHGDNVAIVGKNDMGRGSVSYDGIPDTDALITNVPGVSLMVFFADCVPVLFADPRRNVIGTCHAGWRGTLAQIAEKTVMAMNQHFGTEPGDCLVGIGPAIGQCCYEVDEAVVSRYKKVFSWWEEVIVPHGSKWRLDLGKTNYRQLLDMGVDRKNIISSNICTACNTPLFYSYRAEHGRTGVLAALIAWQ